MSVAKKILEKQQYKLLNHKGEELKLSVLGKFISEYLPLTIVEGEDYYESYLTDTGRVFGKKFAGVVSLGMQDLKQLGFELVSVDMHMVDKKSFPGLPWFAHQKVVHTLIHQSQGLPQHVDVLKTFPQGMEVFYNVKTKKLKLMGKTVSRRQFEEFSVKE